MANEATGKIDDVAVSGLSGTADSLAYKVHEIETHLHSYGRWFETASVPSGTHLADRLGTGGGAFQPDAGNDDWGSWVQLLGSADTPVDAGNTHYDLHELIVVASERTGLYVIQIGFGATGAAALTAGTYEETPYWGLATPDVSIKRLQVDRQTVNTLAWTRCICPGQNTGTIDFYVGLHEYPG